MHQEIDKRIIDVLNGYFYTHLNQLPRSESYKAWVDLCIICGMLAGDEKCKPKQLSYMSAEKAKEE